MTTKKADEKPAENTKAGEMTYERIRIPSKLQQAQAAAQDRQTSQADDAAGTTT